MDVPRLPARAPPQGVQPGLPDTLQLMSGSLAAGLSLAQSIDTIVREGVEPIASEFRRVLVETRLGVDLETALEGVAERFDSKDFEWVVMAINIQRQVGGNLAELLDTVAAHDPRARVHAPPGRRTRRRGQALGVRARRPAAALPGLPAVDHYDYVIVLFSSPLGWADARRRCHDPRRRCVLDVPTSSRWRSEHDHALHHGRRCSCSPRSASRPPPSATPRRDAASPAPSRSRGDDQRAERADAELDKSFGERVLVPLQNRVRRPRSPVSGADTAERIRRKLDLAGNPPGLDRRPGAVGKVIGAMAGLVGGLMFS